MKRMRLASSHRRLVAQFCGLPTSEIAKELGKVREIATCAEAFLKKISQLDTPERHILAHWRTLVGERVSKLCAPIKVLNNTVLLVRVPDAVVRQELLFEQFAILNRLRQLPKCGGIQKLHFK